MKKTYKIEVDCANCANLMEDAAKRTSWSSKCNCKLYDTKNDCRRNRSKKPKAVFMNNVLKTAKRVEPVLAVGTFQKHT